MLITFDMGSGETRCEKTSSEAEQAANFSQRLVPTIGLGLHTETQVRTVRPIPRIPNIDAFLSEMAAYR